MASTLKRFKVQNVTTSASVLTTGSETGPAVGKIWNVPRLYLCNILALDIAITVAHKTGATSTRLVMGKTLTANDTMILENIVLVNGDTIEVTSNTATSIDVFGSILEEDEYA